MPIIIVFFVNLQTLLSSLSVGLWHEDRQNGPDFIKITERISR